MVSIIMLLCLLFLTSFFMTGQTWEQCGNESADNQYFCPDGNKCCSLPMTVHTNDGVPVQRGSWGCISGKDPREGECCQDDYTTGCKDGFACTLDYCTNVQANTDMPLLLPRYKLCSIHHPHQRLVHYLPSNAAFLSSHPISPKGLHDVDQLWIIVHGSDHNPDDYLCCTLSVSKSSNKIWIITPWFLPDGSEIPGLQWTEHGPIEHTWRYGADAVSSNVSSYAVLDDLIAYAQSRVTTLTKIVVAGHSAGGQYVQRWALLTKAWTEHLPMRAIVANPKSFCWLDARRMFPDGFRLPNHDARAICPTYNEWEWGFENSTGQHREAGALYTPYKDFSLASDGLSVILDRYMTRDIVYLAGELDVLWNGDCEDRMQGDCRKKRSENFFKSLQFIYGTVFHRRIVVKGVPHDHCLMFQSPEGQEAFFGLDTNANLVQDSK